MNLKNPIVAVAAILGITAIEIVAIQNKLDGAYVSIVVAAIAGIAGYASQSPKPPA